MELGVFIDGLRLVKIYTDGQYRYGYIDKTGKIVKSWY